MNEKVIKALKQDLRIMRHLIDEIYNALSIELLCKEIDKQTDKK